MIKKTKTFSTLLSLCLIVSILTSMIPVSAVSNSDHVATNNAEDYTEDYLAPDIIDKDELKTTDYVGRVLEDEKDLYTFVFKNGDGSNTMRVFSHPVKYIDDEGATRDISLEISKSKDGTFVATDHMVKADFGTSIADGIGLEYNDIKVSMKAFDANANVNAVLSADGKKLTYAVDDKTSYVYSLTYLGIKEDIVVSEYTGQTEYKFSLFTNGLHPVKIDNSVFLSDVNGDIKASIGDILIFTADERNNTFGDLLFDSIVENEEYAFTIILNAEYLKDEKTAYPITIDPTINVKIDDPDYGGTGAIEDVTINENVTFSGTSGSLYVGRHPAGSLSRTLMRFPNLSLSWISPNQITAASVEIRDLMCQGDEDITIDCCIYNNSSPAWTESGTTTWSSVGTSYVGTVLDSMLVSYGYGNVSAHRYGFNILNLAKAWANNTQSPSKGIVFKAEPAFENQTGSNIKTWYKTFSSYNRASYKPSLTINYNESGFDNATSLSLGTYYSVSVANSGGQRFFKYTPSTTGFYTFESSSIVSGDPYGRLYNNNQDILANNDDGGSGTNFRITYHLMASYTYYFSAGCYSTGTGSYSVRLYKTSSASYIESPTVIAWGDTKSVSISYSQASKYYKFTPTASGEYLFYSSDNTGDPRIWLYDSSLTLIDSDDDFAGNHNFRLVASLISGQSYYISAGHFSTNIGTYMLSVLKSGTLPTGNYFLRNNGTLKYMDIDGPSAQEWIHQWTAHTSLQERWTFQKLSDGYYTIRSLYGSKYYVGISTTSTGVDNIKLYSSISDETKWKIYELSSNHVVLEPKKAVGKTLYVPNASTGTELQLSLMSSVVGNRNQWTAVNIGAYYAQVYSHFDDGYSVYYGETRTDSINRLNGYLSEIAARYYALFGLTILFDGASYYNSPIDVCKGTVTSSNINTLCTHSGTIHTERSNVISSFNSHFSGSNTITNVLWSDHRITSTATSGTINYNRSCSSGTSIIMIERSSTSVRDRDSKSVLMHELNHQYGARDHYHELADSSDPTSCKFKDICSECGTNPRPLSCIMNLGRVDISNSDVICSDCQTDILSHLAGHHGS